MKIIISESKLNKLILSFLKELIGNFTPPASDRGHPSYKGRFDVNYDPDSIPVMYISDDTILVDNEIIEMTSNLFSVDSDYVEKLLIQLCNETLGDVVVSKVRIF